MICTSIQHKTYAEIMELLPQLEMAEIRLDLCPLSDNEIEELFAQTDIPLVATCRASSNLLSPCTPRGRGAYPPTPPESACGLHNLRSNCSINIE